MSEKKDRERVIAEITLSHLMRLGNEQPTVLRPLCARIGTLNALVETTAVV